MTQPYLVGGYTATQEQTNVIDIALAGQRQKRSIKIEAGAGTGKTSTLVALAQNLSGRGVYLSFNKDIAEEAQTQFPDSVRCCTANALAFREVGYAYRNRFSRLNGKLVVDYFNPDRIGEISEVQLANCALAALRYYCYSSDKKIIAKHIPEQSRLSVLDPIEDLDLRAETQDQIILLARKLWKEMDNTRAKLPVTHDFYLKKWALSDPIIDADFIMLDEAQDTNDVLIAVLAKQNAQILYVGDRFQAIYGWRGASNAMAKINTDDTVQITQSFRFGPAVAEVANTILQSHLGANFRVQGFDQIKSERVAVDQPDAILCRSNAVCMQTAIDLLNQGIKAQFRGNADQLLAQIAAVEDLKKKGRTTHPDFNGFTGYRDLIDYSESEEGSDFRSLLNIIRKHGERGLKGVLKTMEGIEQPDTVVVTAHRSKGLEWNSVRLADDFILPDDSRYQEEESHLLYVAVTRAKYQLDLTALEDKLEMTPQTRITLAL